MTSGFGSGVTLPIDDVVRWVILDLNPSLFWTSITSSSANFIDDLGYSSLDLMELFMGMKRFFYVTIDDDTAEKIKTVGDLIRFIENNATGDYSSSVYDDMGRSPNQAGQEAKETAFDAPATSNITFSSTTASRISFSWKVIRHVYN